MLVVYIQIKKKIILCDSNTYSAFSLRFYSLEGQLIENKPLHLTEPCDIDIFDNSIYIIDLKNINIFTLQFQSVFKFLLPIASKYPFNYLKVDMSNIYLTIDEKHQIWVYGHDGKLKQTLGPEKKGDKEGEFNDPRGITCDSTTLYVCDTNNYRIQCISKDKYNVQRSWGTYGIENEQFEFPSSILFYENILYVGDKYCVQLFTCDGIFLQRIGGDEVGKEEGLFNWIKGICVVEDKLYVSDCFNDRVQVFKRSSWCS